MTITNNKITKTSKVKWKKLIQNIKFCISWYTYVYKEYLIWWVFYMNDLQLPDFKLRIARFKLAILWFFLNYIQCTA